jgi:hypothetical protein
MHRQLTDDNVVERDTVMRIGGVTDADALPDVTGEASDNGAGRVLAGDELITPSRHDRGRRRDDRDSEPWV